jgi:hypothetical protein
MPDIDLESLFGDAATQLPHVGQLLARMALAAALGACLAYRVWRCVLRFGSPPSLASAHAQTLIAAAGALMVVMIGDHPARALGLFGIGSLIRFRSGISDTREAAVMFVMIGIGMACGLGLPLMATVATLFVGLLLIAFDATAGLLSKRTLVAISTDDPPLVRARILEALPGARVVELANNVPALGKDSGKLVVELDLRRDMDADKIRGLLDRHNVPGIQRVALAMED